MVVLNLELEKEVECDEVNDFLCNVFLYFDLCQQIFYIVFLEVVFFDFVGFIYVGIVDGLVIIVFGKYLVFYVWYDNEFGYLNQVICIVEEIVGVCLCVFLICVDVIEF